MRLSWGYIVYRVDGGRMLRFDVSNGWIPILYPIIVILYRLVESGVYIGDRI